MLRIFILFLTFSLTVKSQDPDTLLTTLLNLENDTEKVNQLYKYGFDLIDKNPSLAWKYSEACTESALKTKSPKHVSKSYNLAGILFYHKGDYRKAESLFESYLETSKKINNIFGIAYGLTNLGNTYLQLKQPDKAENCYLQAIEYYSKLNDKTEIANNLLNLGVLKQIQNQLNAAYHNYELAYEYGKQLNNYAIKAHCLNNMADVFLKLGEYEKALAFNYDALKLRDIMGLDVDKTDSYLSISEVALKQNNTALAEENLHLACELCDQLQYNEGKMNYYKLTSELYSQKNNYELAYYNLHHYLQLKDSLLQLQENASSSEAITPDIPFNNVSESTLKNTWLLALLLLLLVMVTYFIFKNKR